MKKSLELYAAAKVAAQELEIALNGNEEKSVDVARIKLTTAITDTNEAIREEHYNEWLEADYPIRAAVEQLFVTIRSFSEKQDKNTKIWTVPLKDRPELVNIEAFDGYVKDRTLFNRANWGKLVNSFVFSVAGRIVQQLDRDIGIAAVENAAEIGVANITSNTQMIRQLQNIVDAIIFIDNGEGKNELLVRRCDVERTWITCMRDSKNSSGVVVPRPKTIVGLITRALNRIATNGDYDVSV